VSPPAGRSADEADEAGADPPSGVSVRTAERADLTEIVRLERASFPQPWPRAAFERFLGGPAFLVAVRDAVSDGAAAVGGGTADGVAAAGESTADGAGAAGESATGSGAVLGYVVADRIPNHGRDIGHVKDIAVAPGARGRGIGRVLLEQALVVLAIEGAELVKLEVRAGNEPAMSLYRGEGFEPAQRVPRYYDDGEDAVVMVLDAAEWTGGT